MEIKNKALEVGLLTYTDKESDSGKYAQALESVWYNLEKNKYSPGGSYRNQVLWEISQAEDGYYTIVSKGLNFGFLSWTREASKNGQYAQVLVLEKGYDPRYSAGGTHRDSVLWKIDEDEDGYFTLTNKALIIESDPIGGFLSYTKKGSASGHYVQVLRDNNSHENEYLPDGQYRDHILWEISTATD